MSLHHTDGMADSADDADNNVNNSQHHYEAHSASSYESAFFYSAGDYTNYLANLISDRLGLLQTRKNENNEAFVRRLMDVGGGTGNFTKLLLERSSAPLQAVVVDPFLPATEEGTHDTSIQFVKADAESFAIPLVDPRSSQDSWRRNYHIVLMKEVIHHMNPSDRAGIFKGIHQGFSTNNLPSGQEKTPNLLIVTRPKRDIDYPLWKEAREVWAANQPSAEAIEADLSKAGFTNVKHTVESYPCQIPMSTWLDMVRGRFWSTFSNFDDEELKEACIRMEKDEAHRVDNEGIIYFEDRLLLISACK